MKKTLVKILSVALLVVCIGCIFAGCVSDKSKLQGKWYDKNGDLVLTLNSNGKAKLTNYEGTYKVYDSSSNPYIIIKLDFCDAKVYYDFEGSREMKAKIYLDDSYTGNMTLKKK